MDLPLSVSFDSLFLRTFAQLRQGFRIFLPLSLLALLPYGGMLAIVEWLKLTGTMSDTTIVANSLSLIVLLFVNVIAAQIATAGVSFGVFRHMRDATTSIGECLRVAGGRWLSLVAAALLVALAVVGGFLFFIIPGIIVGVALTATIPALLVEELSATDALRRSWELTSGYRLQIFIIALLVGILGMGVAVVITVVEMVGSSMLSATLSFAWQVIAATFNGVFAAVVYHDLRAVKEGLDEHDLATVFD